MKNRLLSSLLLLALLFMLPLGSSASTFDSLVVYGDSLSDNGNLGVDFTDGDVWVETLAATLGAELFDFAYGGATTWYQNPSVNETNPTDPTLGLQWQIDTYGVPSTENTLYSVWAGANDLSFGTHYGRAALNVGIALEKLYSAGATDILVGNLPDIGSTPRYFGEEGQDLVSGWTFGFNFVLDSVLNVFEMIHTDVNLYKFDAYSMFASFTPGTQEWKDLFWIDGFHPSSIGHQLIYETALAAVAPVPEPSTILLLGSGLFGLAWYGRKRKAA